MRITRYREMWTEIQSSRKCHMYQFLVGIDIPHLGPEAAKALHQYFYGSMEAFEAAVRANFAFSHIAEVPGIVEKSIYRWFEDESNVRMMHAVMTELEFIGMHKELDGKQNPFMDTTVAVTGTFENFTREGILELLATLGAKMTDKVTKDTNYLIYGSVPSNKKVSAAMENRITMLSEKDFGKMIERSHKTEKSTTVFSDKYRYCNATIIPKINNDSIIRAISIREKILCLVIFMKTEYLVHIAVMMGRLTAVTPLSIQICFL